MTGLPLHVDPVVAGGSRSEPRSHVTGRNHRRVGAATVIGLVAVVSSALYFVSDAIEVAQSGFSAGQLWLTLVAEAAVPLFVIGLWVLQRDRLGRIGALSAIAYAYTFVFFTGTVVYALLTNTEDFDELGEALSPAMTIHGAVMVAAGIGFGYATYRSATVPRWTGIALAVGVALVALGLPAVAGLIAVAMRDAAFAGMGVALVRAGLRPTGGAHVQLRDAQGVVAVRRRERRVTARCRARQRFSRVAQRPGKAVTLGPTFECGPARSWSLTTRGRLAMTRTREHKALYVILGIGAVASFFGHAMWAVRGKDSFVALFNGTMDNIFGVTVSARSGETYVKLIGYFDIVVAVVMAALVVGAFLERGRLYRYAYSRLATLVFSWGVVWGFLTALSRVTSAETWYPEIWDWVERAPNFMLPAALIYIVARHRTLNIPTHVEETSALKTSA